MTENLQSCGGMMPSGTGQEALCAPLARLKQEHGPLRTQMEAYARDAASIGLDRDTEDWSACLAGLKRRVDAFAAELERHSEREEGALFPMMANYIGKEFGPIAIMEYEHEQARRNLKALAEAAEDQAGPVNAERAKEIAGYALRAFEVLTDHFSKEENVLFPMAEKMLSTEEKERLSRAFGLS